MTPLEASYRHCRRLARRAASNFYYAFWLLPAEKRRAMCALYAFFRRTDDISDREAPPQDRQAELQAWRESLEAALAGEFRDPLLPALIDTLTRYAIPARYLFDALDGAAMDLTAPRYETFEELREYCYRAASVVGLACIHVWGFAGEQALGPAIACGEAFQLTNILRDLGEDVRRGRIYLPREDLRRFAYGEEELAHGVCTPQFRALMQFEIERAKGLYESAAPLELFLSREGQRTFRLMFATYRALLEEMQRRDGDVFSQRVRLGVGRKLALLANEGMRRLRIAHPGPRKQKLTEQRSTW